MKYHSVRLKYKEAFSPWTLLLLLILALIIFLPALNEYRSAKIDLLQLWTERAKVLSETILRSASKISVFDKEAHERDAQHLLDLARYVHQLDSLYYPDHKPVLNYIRQQGRVRILLFTGRGKLKRHSRRETGRMFGTLLEKRIEAYLSNHPAPHRAVLIKTQMGRMRPIPVVLVPRGDKRGYMALFYRGIPGGRPHRLKGWIEHLVTNPSLVYIILSDKQSILASAGPIPEKWQQPALPKPVSWQIRPLGKEQIFEYHRSEPQGLSITIGLAAGPMEKLQQSLVKRLILNSLLFLLFGGILLFYFLKRQNFTLLQHKYEQLQTSTSSVFKNMEEGIIVVDDTQHIYLVNQAAAQLVHTETEKLEGQLFSVPEWPFPAKIMEDLYANKTMLNREARFSTSRGIVYLLITAQRLHIHSGLNNTPNQHLYVVLFRDITSRKEYEELQQRKGRLLALGELASRVAHEIRNPLNGIGVLAQRLQREFQPEAQTDEFKQMTRAIRQESTRINQIIETFLAYARDPELHLQDVNFSALIEALAPVLPSSDSIQINYFLDENCTVKADADQLKQIVLNLVKNAVEASPGGSEINIKLSCKGKTAAFMVEDHGTGLSEELQKKIFDLYFTTTPKGNGLGLSIVEKIVSAHGGKIQIESPYSDQGKMVSGARFIVELPAV